LVPAPDSSDDFVWVCGPGEGFGIMVGLGDEAVDSGLKIDHSSEDATLQSQVCEEPFDCIEPRTRGRCEVESEAGV